MSQAENQNRTSALIADLLLRRDSGEEIDEDQFIASHPESANELRDYFANERLFEKAVLPSKTPEPARETTGPGAGDSFPVGGSSFTKLPVQFGRYQVQEVLGQGAMGAVYRAHDTRLGRDVALKTPKLDVTSDPELIERFEREARAAAALHHPNICPVFDVGEVDGTRFLTMAFIDGVPLSSLISEEKPLSDRQAAAVVRKLAQALHTAHSHGVIHRDVKPANIMIDRNREPIVMDFGLAHHCETQDQSRLTAVGTLMGSPAYMSPEQVSGNPLAVGPESDIYSLGVVLFELLTGKLPFDGGIAAMVGQIMTAPTPGVRQFRSDCSPELESICLRMMAKDKASRLGSMAEVAEELGSFLKSQKTQDVVRSGPVVHDRELSAALDQIANAETSSIIRPRKSATGSDGGSFNKTKAGWIAGALAGLAVLSGVIIYFSDGTRVELPDNANVKLETNADGTLESITVQPAVQPSDRKPDIPAQKQPSGSDPQVAGDQVTHEANGTVSFEVSGGTASLAVSPDGQYFAISEFNVFDRIQVRDVETGAKVRTLELAGTIDATPTQLSYSPDGRSLLYITGNSCRVIDAETGLQTGRSDCPAFPSLVVFPQRTWALMLFHEREVHRTQRSEVAQRIRIWDWQSDKIIYEAVAEFGQKGSYSFPSISPDERFMTVGLQHNHLRCELTIVDDMVDFGDPVEMEQTSRVRGPLRYSRDGKYAATSVKSRASMAVVLKVETGRIVSSIDEQSAGTVNEGTHYGCECAFTSDGTMLVSADHTGRTAIWDVQTGRLIRDLAEFQKYGHHSTPHVAVTRDDHVILAGLQADPRVRILRLNAVAATSSHGLDGQQPASIAGGRRTTDEVSTANEVPVSDSVGETEQSDAKPLNAVPSEAEPATQDEIRRTAARLIESGATILLDQGTVRVRREGGRGWLTELPPGELNVNIVYLTGTDFVLDDELFRAILRLPSLEKISFGLTDQLPTGRLALLARLQTLTELTFAQSTLTDADLAALTTLPRLQTLYLFHTDITDDGVQALASMPALNDLTIGNGFKEKYGPAFLTDDGLASLYQIKKLDKLWICGREFTDACVEHLAAISQVRRLTLKTPRISDSALNELKRRLPNCRVTDKRGDSDADPVDP